MSLMLMKVSRRLVRHFLTFVPRWIRQKSSSGEPCITTQTSAMSDLPATVTADIRFRAASLLGRSEERWDLGLLAFRVVRKVHRAVGWLRWPRSRGK
jgi:hypothetical protein